MNRNAFIGRNVEVLFKNSVGDHPDVIERIQGYFGIKGRYLNSISTGIHSEKADVKMEFADGHNVDCNIKAFKASSASYNQLTRTSITNFCTLFFDDSMKAELERLFVDRARKASTQTFPEHVREWVGHAFQDKGTAILEWAFSYKQSREILVIYERDSSTMSLFPMKEIVKKLGKSVGFTKKGSIGIGTCVVIQRKGGNGVHSKDIPKDSLRHPGNNVQVKLKMKEFMTVMEHELLASYRV